MKIIEIWFERVAVIFWFSNFSVHFSLKRCLQVFPTIWTVKDYVMEVEDDAVQPSTASTQHGEGEEWPGLQPYQDEPIADPAWIAQYNEERHAKEERRQLLLSRLNGTIPVVSQI